jgi:hypothetical protein
MQYIKREASRVRNNISDEAIQVILNAEMRWSSPAKGKENAQ